MRKRGRPRKHQSSSPRPNGVTIIASPMILHSSSKSASISGSGSGSGSKARGSGSRDSKEQRSSNSMQTVINAENLLSSSTANPSQQVMGQPYPISNKSKPTVIECVQGNGLPAT